MIADELLQQYLYCITTYQLPRKVVLVLVAPFFLPSHSSSGHFWTVASNLVESGVTELVVQ